MPPVLPGNGVIECLGNAHATQRNDGIWRFIRHCRIHPLNKVSRACVLEEATVEWEETFVDGLEVGRPCPRD